MDLTDIHEKNSLLPTVCSRKLGSQRPPELVLLTGQIHHLMAFNCDLLTSCWLVFSSQWPIAISLVITLLKSSRELDNARELYMSPVSSPSKNRTSPLNEISACLQWGATMGGQGEGECVCVCVWGCVCLHVNTYRRLWLWMQRLWCIYVQRLCGLRVCEHLSQNRVFAGSPAVMEIHLTAHAVRHVCVSFIQLLKNKPW